MRLTISFLLYLLLLSPLCAQQLRLMSYNVRNCKGMDGRTDYDRVASVIREADADVVAIEELDSATERSGRAYVLEEIGKRAGYGYTYGPAISFQGGKYGVGLLWKKKPGSIRRYPLPGREEERTLLVADFGGYAVAVAHLSLTEADRISSLGIIARAVAGIAGRKPLFFAGDFNAEPESPFGKGLVSVFDILSDVSQPTYPSDSPRKTIDYICLFRRPGLKAEVLGHEVIAEPMASDHRPVVADVRLNR